MKRALTFLTFALALLLTACSYSTQFIVLNRTDKPVELRYKVKASERDPLAMVGEPHKTGQDKMLRDDKQWQRLAPEEYAVDREARTITIRIMPHEAVLVRQMSNYEGHDSASDAAFYNIEEIHLDGANGEVRLQGEQARRGFAPGSSNDYVLTYR